jgi:hypothetical protein
MASTAKSAANPPAHGALELLLDAERKVAESIANAEHDANEIVAAAEHEAREREAAFEHSISRELAELETRERAACAADVRTIEERAAREAEYFASLGTPEVERYARELFDELLARLTGQPTTGARP